MMDAVAWVIAIPIAYLFGSISTGIILPEEGEAPGTIRIAIAGRPNVGKSALFNSITGEQRAIVSPIPGTTRDAIDSRFSYEGPDLTFLDTAGLRRRGKAEDGIEKYSGIRSIGAIERSHVCLIVLDATEFVTAQDTHIGGFVDDAARAGVIVINKWDLADDQDREVAVATVRERFKFLPDVSVLFTSALTGAGVPEISLEGQPAGILFPEDQCADKINRLRQQGIEYFGCNFDFGGMEHQKVMRSMELFSTEVMPRFSG